MGWSLIDHACIGLSRAVMPRRIQTQPAGHRPVSAPKLLYRHCASCIWSAPSAWGAVFLLIIAIGLPLYLGTYTMNGPLIIVLSYTCIPLFISYGEGLRYRSHSHLTSIYVLIDRIELLVLLSWSQRNPLLKPGRSDSPEKWWTPWI